jgi:hypothetical protein
LGPWGVAAAKAAAGGAGAAVATGPRWGPIFSCARFADGQVASLERLGVELPDHFLGEGSFGELDKCEATGTPGLPVHGHDDVGWFCDGCEVSAKIGFSRAVRQISNKQTDCQCASLKGL